MHQLLRLWNPWDLLDVRDWNLACLLIETSCMSNCELVSVTHFDDTRKLLFPVKRGLSFRLKGLTLNVRGLQLSIDVLLDSLILKIFYLLAFLCTRHDVCLNGGVEFSWWSSVEGVHFFNVLNIRKRNQKVGLILLNTSLNRS